MAKQVGSLLERFLSKVKITDSCWTWQGSLNNKGYGKIQTLIAGVWKVSYAHRVAWFLGTGKWPDAKVLHKCDNPPCVRFDHLFLGSQKDNMQDAKSKGRLGRTVEFCKRGHSLTGDNLYENAGKKHCKECRRVWKRKARLVGSYGANK